MNCRLLIPLLTAAAPLFAQQEQSPADRAVEAQELRLQEQRAAALRTRLLLYSGELQKLRAQYESQKNTAATAVVDAEMSAIQGAIKRLSASALDRLEDEKPAEPPKEGEEEKKPAPATVLAKRVDFVIKQFSEARKNAELASLQGKGRQRVLDFKDAKKGESASTYSDGRDYWTYESSGASWTLSDLQPGLYEVEFRYSCGENGGGTLNFRAAGQTLSVTIPAGANSTRKLTTTAPVQLRITDPAVDLRLSGDKLREGSKYYWNLHEVILRPAGAMTRPRTP